MERSRSNRRTASVAVVRDENSYASPILLDPSRAANRSVKSENIAPIKGQCSVVNDILTDASSRPTVTRLQRACTDRSATLICIVASEYCCTGTALFE